LKIIYDKLFVSEIMTSASPCSICLHLIPTWRRLLTSAHEPRLIYRNRANSLFVLLSNPSAILEDIDMVARRIWSRYQKLFESSNFVNNLLNICKLIELKNHKFKNSDEFVKIDNRDGTFGTFHTSDTSNPLPLYD
jgi:hypothetical protein